MTSQTHGRQVLLDIVRLKLFVSISKLFADYSVLGLGSKDQKDSNVLYLYRWIALLGQQGERLEKIFPHTGNLVLA